MRLQLARTTGLVLTFAITISAAPCRRPCQCPAMPNGRCRIHGGANPGAPKGERNGNYRNGRRTNEAIAERQRLSALMRELRFDGVGLSEEGDSWRNSS